MIHSQSLVTWIARIHLLLALTTALVAGLLSVLLRWQMGMDARPLPLSREFGLFPATGGIIPPEFYGTLFTLHGAGMFFFVLLPGLGVGLATFVFRLHRTPQVPPVLILLAAGLVIHLIGWGCLVLSPFIGAQGPSVGWTYYPPLSHAQWSPDRSLDLYLLALFCWGVGGVTSAMGQILSLLYQTGNLPLNTWSSWDPWRFGHGLAAGSALFAIPSLLVSVGLLLADRWLGTQFLDAKAGDPILHQHLFWFFGHPAVYMLILPIMGFFTSQLLPPEWKGRWPQSLALGCMGCIAVLGFAAWGHHMFQSGLDPRVSGRFSTATLLISWPSALLVGLWLLMALRTASLPQRPPGFWHGLAFLVLFSAGGLGGVLLATAPLNAHLHETYWVVGHIHLVLFGGSALGLAGALFLLSPELLPRPLTRGSMLAHLALTLPLLLFVFGMMHWMGFAGLGRRMYQVPALDLLNQVRAPNAAVAYGAFALLLGQGMLVLSLLEGLGVLPRNISRMMSLFLVVLSTTLMGLAWLTLLRAGWGWWLLPIFSPMSMGVALAVWNLLRLDVPLRPVPLGDPIPAP